MFHTLGLMKNRVAQSRARWKGEYRIGGERKVLAGVDRIYRGHPGRAGPATVAL